MPGFVPPWDPFPESGKYDGCSEDGTFGGNDISPTLPDPASGENEDKPSNLDRLQAVLRGLGMLPWYGNVFDALNTGVSLGRGNWADAGFSAASAIPLYGIYLGGTRVQVKVGKAIGRRGKQQRLRELAKDPRISNSDRGWIKQDLNEISRGKRKSIRNPKGKDLAHERGREAAKGYNYKRAYLQDRDLHKTQHKYDNYGRKNKERPLID